MKQQKFFVIVITVCALLLSLAGCASSSAFDGSSAKNADSYHLDVKNAKGRIHVDVEKVPASTEPAETPEPSNSTVEEEILPAEAPTRETTDTSVSIAPPVQEHNNPDAVTAEPVHIR